MPSADNLPCCVGLLFAQASLGEAALIGLITIITWFWWVVPIILWIRMRRRRTASIRRTEQQGHAAEKKRLDSGRDSMAALGATETARSASIEDLFNRKAESISFETMDVQFTRSIAAMPAREREVLRAAYHLFNAGQLEDEAFYRARLALVFGEGKAQVTPTPSDALDFSKKVATQAGMNVEGAVSAVLDRLQTVLRTMPDHPTIRLLAGRLLGGGSLSSSAAFAATQQGAGKPALILGKAEDTGKTITFSSEGSVITIAPPGSGKTQCHVFPTLLSWVGPAVVLDVKGEIYAGTSKWRSEHVGPVYRFAPLDPSTSHHYNPLTYVRSDPEYLWEDARFLADMMLVPNSNAKDPFWENRARDVLTAAIARSCLTDDPGRRSMGSVLDIFHGVEWDAFVRELQARVDIRSLMRAGSSLGEMDRKTRDGVLQTGLSALSAWDGDRIERATRSSDWSPLDLRGGRNPTIYICLKPNEVESYISVLRVFIAQHIRMLTATLPAPGATPILFVLDELPRLREMPPVEEALEIGRQYGLKLWMFAQSLGQLENAYKNSEGMVGSCAVRMYMNPSLHDGTAQRISDELGFQEGVLDGSRQKIVEPPVLAGPDYKDFVIVMASGFGPFRLRKAFAYQDQAIASRMGGL